MSHIHEGKFKLLECRRKLRTLFPRNSVTMPSKGLRNQFWWEVLFLSSDLIYRDTAVTGVHKGFLSLRESSSVLGTVGLRALKAGLGPWGGLRLHLWDSMLPRSQDGVPKAEILHP